MENFLLKKVIQKRITKLMNFYEELFLMTEVRMDFDWGDICHYMSDTLLNRSDDEESQSKEKQQLHLKIVFGKLEQQLKLLNMTDHKILMSQVKRVFDRVTVASKEKGPNP
jgi:prolyl oligopeptidase PreP (S9A serine peptidase family)